MLPVVLLFFLATQDNGDPGGFCLLPNANQYVEVWEVDSDSALPSGITIPDALRLADFSLNNLSRGTRGEFRHRVLNSTSAECVVGTSGNAEGCIEFRTNSADVGCGGVQRGPCTFGFCPIGQTCFSGQCRQECSVDGDCPNGDRCPAGLCVPTNPAGYANCNAGGTCYAVVCRDNVAASAAAFRSAGAGPLRTLTHELGHTLGLQHVNDGQCATNGGTPPDPDDCSTTDDCDGELMCTSSAGCAIGFTPQEGEGRGVRRNYGNMDGTYRHRRIFRAGFGAAGSGSIPDPTFGEITNAAGVHVPRIDCTTTSSSVMRCAMVRHRVASGLDYVRVNALTSPSGNSWSNTFITEFQDRPTFTPDIAVSPGGTIVYTVYAVQGRLFATRTCANCENEPDSFTEIVASNEGRSDTRISAVQPPRIVYLEGSSSALVVVMGVKRNDTPSPNIFTTPVLQAYRLPGNLFDTFAQTSDDLLRGSAFADERSDLNAIAGEFDVGCRLNGSGTQCVLVAPRLHSNAPNGRPSSARWDLTSTTFSPQNWVPGLSTIQDVVAVTGVSMSSSSLFVSYARRNTGNTDTTIVARYSGTDVGTVNSWNAFLGDAETCNSVTVDASSIPAVSTLGAGYSISWCQTCSTPQLEGLTFGRPADDPNSGFCF